MWSRGSLARLGVAAAAWLTLAAGPAPTVICSLDLAKPFAARSPWRLTVSQGPEIEDPVMGEGKIPGEIHLCLRKASASCDPALRNALRSSEKDDIFAAPHYFDGARVVRSPAGPLLWVETHSLYSADGDHLILAQALAYRPAEDRFVRVYDFVIGSNNNQDIRYIETGRLKGRIVSVEPTNDAPFGYWVTVSAAGKDGVYRQVLKFRSATHYGDGNRLGSSIPRCRTSSAAWVSGGPASRSHCRLAPAPSPT